MNPDIINNSLIELSLKADVIDEASATLYYFAYMLPGASDTSQANCYIVRMEKTGNVWKRMYANGTIARNLIFDDRASYTYYFKR